MAARHLIACWSSPSCWRVLPLGCSDRIETVAVRILIFAIMAVGWNLMSGYGGMFSFGHAAFFGIGAYTDAYLLVEHGVSPWIGDGSSAPWSRPRVGVLIAFLCAALPAGRAPTSRWRRSPSPRCSCWSPEPRRRQQDRGLQRPDPARVLAGRCCSSRRAARTTSGSRWASWSSALAGHASCSLRSRAGQFVQAVRDDEVAAASLGINAYALPAHHGRAVSAAITAVAGAFYTQYYFFVGPDQALRLRGLDRGDHARP